MNRNIKIGDYVTRKSYGNDIIFEIIKIEDNNCILHGVELRIIADASSDDLNIISKNDYKIENYYKDTRLDKNRNNTFFYIPGKILHLDGDKRYLDECIKYYKKNNILAFGIDMPESKMKENVRKYLEEINPNILVITGHDAFIKKTKKYKNSANYIQTIKEARKYNHNHEELLIIAGACQSDYEGLIRAGATFASSPKKINIHALDPAIIAANLSLKDKHKLIDLKEIISKTKFKESGMGGLQSYGTMEIGYPRKDLNEY